MDRIVFTKEQLEEFFQQCSDEIVRNTLGNLESFNIENQVLKSIIKNNIHRTFRHFVGNFTAFLLGYKDSFEFEFKKPSSGK